ncbi:MAG: 4'-phosphopantetheinyl transferase [Luminiphilus sp.]
MPYQPLFPELSTPGFVTGWAPLGELQGELDPAEWQEISTASTARQRDFIAGRRLAKAISATLGLPPYPVRCGEDRSPVWPDDRAGSLSHGKTLCAAAIGKRDEIRSVGIDIESVGRVEPKLWPTLFTEREVTYFASLEADQVAKETTLFFSAKETFYKCQYPVTHSWVGFHDVEIQRRDDSTLSARPTHGSAQIWHQSPIHLIQLDASHVVTLMVLEA